MPCSVDIPGRLAHLLISEGRTNLWEKQVGVEGNGRDRGKINQV